MIETGLIFLTFLIPAYMIIRFTSETQRWYLLAVLELAVVWYFFFRTHSAHFLFAALIVFLGAYHLVLRWETRSAWKKSLLVGLPIVLILATKLWKLSIVGASYLAFRLIYLSVELESRVVTLPSFSALISYVLFVPTLAVGPISPSRDFFSSIGKFDRQVHPISTCLYRILVGVVKAYFVSLLFQRLGFESLWADSYNHGLIDFAICSISYFVYLYMSFSGYCDVAIGSAGLLGIRIKENFNRPFTARNIQDFWARWHITLSDFMKELVFNPTLKAFMVKFGSGQRQLSIGVPLTMGLTFFLIGIWHGFHLNFVIYGVMQAVAVSVVHIYGNFLKKRLGTAGVARYKKNKWIFAASWLLTFSFMTLSLFVFQNSYEDARKILTELRLRP